jgi:phosphoribosyl 1,2-cyclic phosphodiesterase
MSVAFTVLASGSRGNSALVRTPDTAILIDLGLGSKSLTARLEEAATSWDGIGGALLTHTHGDHVSDSALRALAKRGIPLYCHEGHVDQLAKGGGFQALHRAGGVRHFDERPFLTRNGLRVEPITLSHDGGPTFGFRVEGRSTRRGRAVAVGYVADTGIWRRPAAETLMDVDVLGVEFNHDVEMQRNSGRAPYLIARNLGPRGHLSNDQGASLVSTVISESADGAVRHVVLLHLSEHCNRPLLALNAARAAVRSTGRSARIHVASQWNPFPHLPVVPCRLRRPSVAEFPWERSTADVPFRLAAES